MKNHVKIVSKGPLIKLKEVFKKKHMKKTESKLEDSLLKVIDSFDQEKMDEFLTKITVIYKNKFNIELTMVKQSDK